MLKYKLIVMRDITPEQKIPSYKEEYAIGFFKDEEALARWANQNQGELKKSQYE